MDDITLRKVQLVQLEIAKEVKRICDENHINYFLDAGTLLGAVRHKGFIPWDDDLDIGMLRTDYVRFLKIAPQALSSGYVLVDWNNSNYHYPFCKIMRNNTEYVEEGAKESDYFKGIYIDVFPYDVYPDKADSLQRIVINVDKAIIRNKCGVKTWIENGRVRFFKFIKNLPLNVLGLFLNLDHCKSVYEKYAIKHNNSRSECYFSQGIFGYGKWIVPRKCLDNLEELIFEGELFSVPSYYDEYLSNVYGNYMELPPEDQRGNRHKIIKVSFDE